MENFLFEALSRKLENRDLSLDIAKGIAAMLVIAGHTAQSARADFDAFLPFRLIYSFHMPLFIFLSGAVMSLRPPAASNPDLSMIGALLKTSQVIGRSAERLLTPFAVWTLIGWGVHRRNEIPLLEWITTVVKTVDYSLWFLLTIFYCIATWQLWSLGLRVASDCLRRTPLARMGEFVQKGYISIPLSLWIVPKILQPMTGHYGLGFLRAYFFVFMVGMFFWLYCRDIFHGWKSLGCGLIFVLLAPFWYRLYPSVPAQIMANYIGIERADFLFRSVVSLCGIFVVLALSKRLSRTPRVAVKNALAFCGLASLGIYAVHFYLLGYKPPFFAPLAGSLVFYFIFSRVPGLSLLFLGERRPVH